VGVTGLTCTCITVGGVGMKPIDIAFVAIVSDVAC